MADLHDPHITYLKVQLSYAGPQKCWQQTFEPVQFLKEKNTYKLTHCTNDTNNDGQFQGFL